MDSTELLYDHYKDSCELSKLSQGERNKLFIILTTIIAAQFILVLEPESLLLIFFEWLKESFHVNVKMEFKIIQSLLWFILLYFTIRYYQVTTYIERQYSYIYKLESMISVKIVTSFNRESGNYLENYPRLLDFISVIYRVLYPILYLVVASIKIGIEICTYTFSASLILDLLLFACCFGLTFLYLVFLHKKYVIAKFKKLKAWLFP